MLFYFQILLICTVIVLIKSKNIIQKENIIQLNPNSTIYTDIHRISHDILNKQIIIELNGIRRCDNPTFIVRFSGAAMYKLKLLPHTHEPRYINRVIDFLYPTTNKYIYTYPTIIDEGVYYLEILVLLCNRFDNHNYQYICLENVHNFKNLINLNYEIYLHQDNSSNTYDGNSKIESDSSIIDTIINNNNESKMRWKYSSGKYSPRYIIYTKLISRNT